MSTGTTVDQINEALNWVDKVGLLEVHHKDKGSQPALKVPVLVKDMKFAYGNVRLLVSPVGGEGEWWVNSVKVEISK